MKKRPALTYRDAGVNIDANDEMVDRIRSAVQRTYGPRVLPSHGGFAGLLRLDAKRYRDPVLVACTDGVGTKVLVGIKAGRVRSLGIDLVAMSVNDMLTVGAEPLLFLDYVALHTLEPRRVAEIVEGIADGCGMAGCALLGGETAEMPDLYRRDDFDLAGFGVGVVERRALIDGRRIAPGDVVLGLASSGLHSNGYALARKLVFERARKRVDQRVAALGESIGDALLRPTRIYVRPVLATLRKHARGPAITGMAHITGGGLPGNLPRILPPGCDIVLDRGAWPIPPIFAYLQSLGVEPDEMYRVFNMGIGFCLITRPGHADAVAKTLRARGETVFRIGAIEKGRGRFRWAGRKRASI